MKKFPRSDTKVAKAKRAQYERLGQSGAYGKRKRCTKGKSCGASCISNYKVCMVDLPWVGGNAMNMVRDRIMGMKEDKGPDKKGPPPIMPIFDAAPNLKPPTKFKFSELR